MRCVLAMPRYGNNIAFEAGFALWAASGQESPIEPELISPAGSLLTSIFNGAWAHARNCYREDSAAGKETLFAMIHSDIGAEPFWLDKLYYEMRLHDLDLLSVVIPIKDQRGITSTGLDSTGDPYRIQRLTLTEIYELPETFTAEDAGAPLCLNTGLWVCRLGDWCLDVLFRQQDAIRWESGPNGMREVARCIPEDFDFSRQLRDKGVRIGATRKIKAKHFGDFVWGNQAVYGDWKTDEANGKHPAATAARDKRKASANGHRAREVAPALAGA